MNFVVFYQIFETFALPAILPWIFISLMLQSNILFRHMKQPPELLSQKVLSIFFNIMSIGSTIGYLMYEYFKRRANKILYNRKNESLWRIIEYPILFVVNLFGISVPTFTLAAFSTFVGQREYIVAEKKNTVKN